MPAIDAIVEYLFWLTIAGYLVLYVRLRQQGLHRTYRVFAAYLLFRAARAVALAILPLAWHGLHNHPYRRFSNNVYAWGWTLTEPLVWILHVLVVLELYSLVLQNYKGIASMGRWALLAGLTLAVLLSSVTLPGELSHSAQQYKILRCYFVVSRGLDASLVIFLLFIAAFLAWFPVPLNRNVVLYSMVYAVYFIAGALAELASNLRGTAAWNVVNLALVGMDLLCIGLWIVFLNRAGEAKTVVVRHAWTPQHEELLVEQLAAINTSLMRSARR
ncbi:MAG: hypothetical protein ABSH46_06860 [Bryobacteraceae bacterium]